MYSTMPQTPPWTISRLNNWWLINNCTGHSDFINTQHLNEPNLITEKPTWFSHCFAMLVASWQEDERLEFSSKSFSISEDWESICQWKLRNKVTFIYQAHIQHPFTLLNDNQVSKYFTSIRSFCLLLSNRSTAKAISCNCFSSFSLSSYNT